MFPSGRGEALKSFLCRILAMPRSGAIIWRSITIVKQTSKHDFNSPHVTHTTNLYLLRRFSRFIAYFCHKCRRFLHPQSSPLHLSCIKQRPRQPKTENVFNGNYRNQVWNCYHVLNIVYSLCHREYMWWKSGYKKLCLIKTNDELQD